MGFLRKLFGRKKRKGLEEAARDTAQNPETCKSQDFIGQVAADRYKIERLLTESYKSRIYIADDQETREKVVVKRYDPHYDIDPRMFPNELSILKRLDHEGIVRVYSTFELEEAPCLVLEYLPGECEDYFKDQLANKDAFFNRLFDFMEDLGSIVQYLVSEEVRHRDINPNNILLDKDRKLKLIDFDIAMDLKNSKIESMFAGTPYFMPPEGCLGLIVTETYDVYGVGFNALVFLYNYLRKQPLTKKHKDYELREIMISAQVDTIIEELIEGVKGKCPKPLVKLIRKSISYYKERPSPSEFMEELELVRKKL